MSIASKIHPLRHLPTAALLLSLLCACSFYEYEDNTEEADPVTPTEKYINLSIVVSSGNEGTTRAPLGGENGDGREAGSERENKVTGITLMLYKSDEKGINTTQDPFIDYIQYFPTMLLDSRDNAGTNYDHYDDIETEKSEAIEVKYTTGEQPLGSGIDKDTEYHVIVVANWDLRDLVTAGETRLATVRELATSHIYTGNGIGVNATSFIMASEKDDPTIQLSSITPTPKENKLVYDIGTIRIERLAARVDFWMKGAIYKENGIDNSDDKRPGYEYAVTRSDGTTLSPDKFLLTAVTPFNLYKDKEYLIKHLNPSKDGKVVYLDDESQYSYVIDPKTNDKETVSSGAEPDYYLNPLSGLVNDESNISTIAEEWRQTTQSLYDSKNSLFKNFDDNKSFGDDNFILCYPKENALMLASPLYYYATGVAIEGYYYKNGEGEGEYHVYYGFLRHQGEEPNDIYEIYKAEDFKNENDLLGKESTPMNFGIVRNNIYRISIDKITEKGNEPPKITWQIKVKKWDKFTHSTIYM